MLLSEQNRLGFREDINGLRAYAVIAVVLYHYGISGFPGGFVGVDVFFVISGFLMTAIIVPKLESGSFSLADFYFARARRILPALVFLCLALLVLGWFWLPPHLYEALGKSAGASILFISNFTYNRAGGYFATPAHDNWLLHTWSLSVEWQFYLVYPLLLMGTARLLGNSRKALLASLSLAAALSLAYCMIKTQSKPSSAFYLLPTRSWELLTGSLVFLAARQMKGMPNARLIEAAGILLIALSVAFYGGGTQWPGYQAVAPVLGAGLIILAARQDSWWTGNRMAQALGRWSYSIYLWHWPLVVALRYFEKMQDLRWLLLAAMLSIVLGALSYRLVERPSTRFMQGWAGGRRWGYAGAGVALPFMLAAAAYFDEGIARTIRLSPEVIIAANEKKRDSELTRCNTMTSNCILGKGDVHAVLWGDSHAIFAVNAVAETAAQSHAGVLFFGQQACPTIFNASSVNPNAPDFCSNFNEMVFSRIRQLDRAIPIVIINRAGTYIEPGERMMYFNHRLPESAEERRSLYFRNMVDSLCRIAATHPLYLVKPMPEMRMDVPAAMEKSLLINGEPLEPSTPLSEYLKNNEALLNAMEEARNRCGVKLLDPVPYLCDTELCYGSRDGRPLYYDDNHLSNSGNRLLAPMFRPVFE